MYEGFLGGLVRRYGWRKLQIAFWVGTATGVLLIIPVFVFFTTTLAFWGGVTLYSGSLLFCLGLAGTIIIPNRRRRYAVFDMALAHPPDAELLVDDQPAPDIAALTLPTNIDLVWRKPLARFGTIATWLMFLTLFLIWRDVFLLVILALLTLGILASFVQSHDVIVGGDEQQVRVTGDEIVVNQKGNRRESIAWDDVRVFALTQQSPNANVYMVSSGKKDVYWSHRLHTRWYSISAPTTSDDEYQRQMDALLSYIAARTGLPLLDLR